MAGEGRLSDKPTVTIVTAEAPVGRRDRGDPVRRVIESSVAVDGLRDGLGRFVDVLAELLESRETRAGAFELDEIAFGAEIGADGEFKLLGVGAGISASSAVTLTWRRRPAADT
jgi:hypothetical protein